MATLNNSINAIPPTYSSVTMANAITSPITITSTSSLSQGTSAVNSYLQGLIRNTSPNANETLLFNISFGLTGVLTTGGSIKCWIETNQVTGITPTIAANYSVGDIAVLTTAVNFSMNVPVLISQIANAGNTSFAVVIQNNTGVSLSLNSMSMYVPVTYVYAGLQVS